jgi:hypothetical protein
MNKKKNNNDTLMQSVNKKTILKIDKREKQIAILQSDLSSIK